MKLPSCSIVIVVLLALANSTVGDHCCQGNKVLDIQIQKCVDNPTVSKTYQEDNGVSDPMFTCPNGWESFKTRNISVSGAIVEPHFNQTLQTAHYCVHSTVLQDGYNESVIAFCRPPPIQLKKCCPLGQSVNRSSIGECVANDRVFNVSRIVTKGWPYEIQENYSLHCDYGYNIYVPKKFVDNFFFVNPSGRLVVPRSMYRNLDGSNNYCVDQAVDMQGNQENIATICLPWRMHILRFLLWDVYSWLHFVSAFFLVLTLIVYCIFPTLRDNIQGYSMICFLLCMIIVQTEYGILLSLPREPHTWCFFKTQASNYFRYASSTWITVMGFNIWNQLSRGPKPLRRNEMYKRFAWCSIYAWGVPLVLQMAVLLYRQSLGPPVELCWFGNPVIKHLLSTPNVVLVTSNLIFFIPSALKVYGSLRFLKTSVSAVALNRLEKQRITTIFRFFLLMQFYTIPRIVHEIVDSDNASPEFLAFSISLYLLIGPAMFYFFVCKTEVFKLITELGNNIKEQTQTSDSTKSTKFSSVTTLRFWRSRSYETSSESGTTKPKVPSLKVESIKYKTKGEENETFEGDEVPSV